MSGARDPVSVLAGEYVLGLLDAAEREAVRRRAVREPAFAAAIAEWQRDFEAVAETVSAAPPGPQLWQRIEATAQRQRVMSVAAGRSHHGTGDGVRRQIVRWRMAAIGMAGLAVMAGVTAIQLERARSGLPIAVAILLPADREVGAGVKVTVRPDGTAEIQALPETRGEGVQIDLWALPANETEPRLVGRLPTGGGRLALASLPLDRTVVMLTAGTGSGQAQSPGSHIVSGRTRHDPLDRTRAVPG